MKIKTLTVKAFDTQDNNAIVNVLLDVVLKQNEIIREVNRRANIETLTFSPAPKRPERAGRVEKSKKPFNPRRF